MFLIFISIIFRYFVFCSERFTLRFTDYSKDFFEMWGGICVGDPDEENYIGELCNVKTEFIYKRCKKEYDCCFKYKAKIKLSDCFKIIKDPFLCRTSCFKICPKDEDFEDLYTIYIQFKPYEGKNKTEVPKSDLPVDIVRNSAFACDYILKARGIAIKVSRENPFKNESDAKKDEEPGTSTGTERENNTSYNLQKKRKRESSNSNK